MHAIKTRHENSAHTMKEDKKNNETNQFMEMKKKKKKIKQCSQEIIDHRHSLTQAHVRCHCVCACDVSAHLHCCCRSRRLDPRKVNESNEMY